MGQVAVETGPAFALGGTKSGSACCFHFKNTKSGLNAQSPKMDKTTLNLVSMVLGRQQDYRGFDKIQRA